MKVIVLSLLTLLSCMTYAQKKYPVGKSFYNVNKENIAIKGYDLVSYFEGSPKKGKTKFAHKHEGLTYFFSSNQNLNSFKDNPENYLPQYGGYCAFGLGAPAGKYGFNPQKFDIDPTSYKILDNKLLLFFKNASFDAKQFWQNESEQTMVRQADSIWSSIEAKYKGLKIPEGMSAKAPPETLQMAFLAGSWKIDYKQKRQDGSYSLTKGKWYGYFTPDGMSIIDYWGKGMPVQGINVRTFDPNSNKWSMTWIQNNTLGNKALIEGEEINGKMVFHTKYWELDPTGQYQNRITFYDISENSFSYFIDTSTDGGKTWIEKTTIIEATKDD
ncbi:YHS domain-containing (seleno)protein [Winogradskyella sp. 3972H.M.0a.05]|uniref:YHS domain-containing (seleno)protein n=1 Tax=Winogradskyella sp. 3972H.M.0a.05 TaxID=2950277 RepID=UPI0033971465